MTKSIYRKILYFMLILWTISFVYIAIRTNFFDDFAETMEVNRQINRFENGATTKTCSDDDEEKLELKFKSKEDKDKYEELKAKQNAIHQKHNTIFDKIFAGICLIFSWSTVFFVIGGIPFYDDLPE